MPKYTLSHISRSHSQSIRHSKGSGIGWSDEGIAMYNKLYDCVATDRSMKGDAFNKELLKVHQARWRKKEKEFDHNVDTLLPHKKAKDDLKPNKELNKDSETEVEKTPSVHIGKLEIKSECFF